jgi:hypothetical protein
MPTTASGSGLALTLSVPGRAGLDEVLVGLVTLRNDGDRPLTTSARLTLAEDLAVLVTGPDGRTSAAGWPWPVDSGARSVDLAPTAQLDAGVLLLCTASSMPLFPVAGRYTLVAELRPFASDALVSAPVDVLRTEPSGDAAVDRQRALLDRTVIQSLVSASALPGASAALEDLANSGTGTASLLAQLAAGTPPTTRDLAPDPLWRAAALSAVLFPGDPRRVPTAATTDRSADDRVAALLEGRPYVAGSSPGPSGSRPGR